MAGVAVGRGGRPVPPRDRAGEPPPGVGDRGAAPVLSALLRRGILLERLTLGWNVVGVAVLLVAALASRSVALAGFGLDSLIEIGASAVVLWELTGADEARQARALRLIGWAFAALAGYLFVQSTVALAVEHRPGSTDLGLTWTAVTAVVMLLLARGKAVTGAALSNRVLTTEARVTYADAALALAVLVGVALDTWLGWWWSDPLCGLVIVLYAGREARTLLLRG